MTAALLLADLSARGFALRATGENLEIRGPKSALTPALRHTIRERKADLLALLTTEATPQRASGGGSRTAKAFVEDLLDRAVVFAERQEGLLWFAPFPVTAMVATTLRSRKHEILSYLRTLPPRSQGCWSRRSWGDPTESEIEDLAQRSNQSVTYRKSGHDSA